MVVLTGIGACNSDNRLGDRFHGRDSATLSGALLPARAHASKYTLSQLRGLIFHIARVAKIENSIIAMRPDQAAVQ